jgi:hypothetical protein
LVIKAGKTAYIAAAACRIKVPCSGFYLKKISGIKNNQGELFLIVREIPTCPPGRADC